MSRSYLLVAQVLPSKRPLQSLSHLLPRNGREVGSSEDAIDDRRVLVNLIRRHCMVKLAPEKNQFTRRVAITNKVPTSWASCTKCNQRRRGRCSDCRLVKRLKPARGVGEGGMRQARVPASKLFEYGSSWTVMRSSRVSKDGADDGWVDWEAWQVGSSGRLDQSIAVVLFWGGVPASRNRTSRGSLDGS